MMEELASMLLEHARRYPLLEPTDAVKLIYQNELGGGHLITDPAACLSYLRREYEATPKDPTVPLLEPIGNGILRVHLAPLKETELEALGQCFLRSAQAHQGNMARFLEKLDILRSLTAQGHFPFDSATLDAYLDAYARAGYPVVSHSQRYRNAYRPAYRIVAQRYFHL